MADLKGMSPVYLGGKASAAGSGNASRPSRTTGVAVMVMVVSGSWMTWVVVKGL